MCKKMGLPLLVVTVLFGVLSWYYMLPTIIAYELSPGEPVLEAPTSDGQGHIAFIAVGDQGSGTYRQYLVAALMEEVCMRDRNLNFVLLLGDNFYWDGVDSVADGLWKSNFEDVYDGRCVAGLPYYAVLGNHDYRGNAMAQVEYSNQSRGSGRWHMPGTSYVVDFGAVEDGPLFRVAVLDTSTAVSEAIEVLRKAFESDHQAVWNIVAGHIPIRSFDAKYGDNTTFVHLLLPWLSRLSVDLYISGHAHSLQLVENEGEPLQLISGAGGKRPLPLVETESQTLRYGKAELGFAKLDVSRNNLRI